MEVGTLPTSYHSLQPFLLFKNVVDGNHSSMVPSLRGFGAVGDIVTVVVDFDLRQIHHYVNYQLSACQPMEDHITQLWPVVSFCNEGQVEILKDDFVPPATNRT